MEDLYYGNQISRALVSFHNLIFSFLIFPHNRDCIYTCPYQKYNVDATSCKYKDDTYMQVFHPDLSLFLKINSNIIL